MERKRSGIVNVPGRRSSRGVAGTSGELLLSCAEGRQVSAPSGLGFTLLGRSLAAPGASARGERRRLFPSSLFLTSCGGLGLAWLPGAASEGAEGVAVEADFVLRGEA